MNDSLRGLRVVIADDHATVRFGFRALLEGAGAAVIGEAGDGEEALRLYADLHPDVLMMDISMPGKGGLAALEQLLARHPKARVLVVSALNETAVPVRALGLGARGFLCKRAQPEELVRAVSVVARDQRYIDPELAQDVALAQLAGSADPTRVLSDKEFAVFMQLASGRSVNEVAESFCLSPSTIGTHLYHIKQKLELNNAAEMALLAVRCGLIEA